MKKSSKLSDVLHVLLHMADQSEPMTSDALAAMMRSNPVVVRRTLGGLRDKGLVSSSKGRAGGWTLTCDLSRTTLLDVYRAVGKPALFAFGSRNQASGCLIEKAVHKTLVSSLLKAEALLLENFKGTTLLTLYADFSAGMRKVRKSRGAARAHG